MVNPRKPAKTLGALAAGRIYDALTEDISHFLAFYNDRAITKKGLEHIEESLNHILARHAAGKFKPGFRLVARLDGQVLVCAAVTIGPGGQQ